jgi:hypothetical protein
VEYKQDKLLQPLQLTGHIIVRSGSYRMITPDIAFTSSQTKKYSYSIFFKAGDYYGGNRISLNPDIGLIISKLFRFGVNYEYERILFPGDFSDNGNALFESHLISSDFSLTYSPHFSIKLLVQYDNGSNSIGNNLRIRYNPKEGTDLYMVYNSGVNTHVNRLDPHLPAISNQAITIKFSKTFGL